MSNRPAYKTCTTCGRNAHKVAARIDISVGRTKVVGFCPSCFANAVNNVQRDSGYTAGLGASSELVYDLRARKTEGEKAAAVVCAFLAKLAPVAQCPDVSADCRKPACVHTVDGDAAKLAPNTDDGYLVEIDYGQGWEPHFHGTREDCDDEADDVNEHEGQRARVVSDPGTKLANPAKTEDGAVTHPASAEDIAEAEAEYKLAVTPEQYERAGRALTAAETNPDNAGERIALGSLIAELAGDDYVTTTEAAAVLDWCQEWARDCEQGELFMVNSTNLLHVAHRLIDGGMSFVLADVRRCEGEADARDFVEAMSAPRDAE